MRFPSPVVKEHRKGEGKNGNKRKPSPRSNTAGKQQSREKRIARLAPFRFVPGDKRINRKGRPRSFDEIRKLAQKILSETVTTRDGETLTGAEALLRSWATSREPALQLALI